MAGAKKTAKKKGARGPELRLPKLDVKVVLLAVVAGAAVVAAWILFTGPQREQAARAAQDAKAAQDALQVTNQKIADIRSGKKTAAAELLGQAQRLDVLLPADADKIDLVTKIPQLARTHRVSITKMDPVAAAGTGTAVPAPATPATPGAPTAGAARSPVQAQTFSMGASGTAADLTAWMAALQSYPALVGMSDVNLTLSSAAPGAPAPPAPGGPGTAAGPDSVTFTLKAFYVPSPVIRTQ